MIKKITTLICALLVLSATYNNLTAAEQPSSPVEPVRLEYGTKYDISNVSEIYVLRVPISLALNVKTIKPYLLDVTFSNRHDAALAQAFKADMEKPADGENVVPAIIVTINTKSLEQGTYQLMIYVEPENSGANLKRQILTLELTLPAAKLLQPGTIIVEQTITPWSVITEGNPNLLLLEMSGKQTRLDGITVQPITPSSEGNKATSAFVNFTPPAQVAPGSSEPVPISLSGAFPLGTYKGNALIKSPQMAEAVTVPFEIRVRRHWGYIIATISAGLILGFLTRIWAQRQFDLYNARASARDALRSLKQELLRRPDAGFKAKVEPAVAKIEQAQNESNVDVIVQAVKDANAILAEALKELDARRAEARKAVEMLSRITETRQLLPAEFEDIFDIKDSLAQARLSLTAEKISGAQQILNDLMTGLAGKINNALAERRPITKSFLDAWGELSSLLPTSATSSLIQTITSLGKEIDAVNYQVDNLTVEEIVILANALKNIRFNLSEFLRQLQLSIAVMSRALRAQFDAVDKKDEGAINELFEKIGELQKKLKGWADSFPETEPPVEAEIIDLKAVWRKALIAQAATDEKTKTEINALLDDEKYREATAKTIQFLIKNPNRPSVIFLGAESDVAARQSEAVIDDFANLLLPSGNRAAAPDSGWMIFNIAPESTLAPVFEIFRSGSWWNFALANGLRFLSAAIGIIAVGYALFADKFIGSVSDLLAIFVWAFGLDLSINTFLDAGKKLKG